jgi:hypothetical protein
MLSSYSVFAAAAAFFSAFARVFASTLFIIGATIRSGTAAYVALHAFQRLEIALVFFKTSEHQNISQCWNT